MTLNYSQYLEVQSENETDEIRISYMCVTHWDFLFSEISENKADR
jgi:hypothetical protein